MKKIKIIAIDDHKLIREMWKLMFAADQFIEVIGDAGTFSEAIDLIKQKRADVVLLDINLEKESGLDLVPLIRKFSPGTKIIVVSMHNEPAYTKKTMRMGVKGYVSKNSSHKEMVQAITEVMQGKTFIGNEIKDILAEHLMANQDSEPDIKNLSLREMEVVKLIAEGFSSKEIADRLNIASKTVEVHRHNIFKKLKVGNTAALMNFLHRANAIV